MARYSSPLGDAIMHLNCKKGQITSAKYRPKTGLQIQACTRTRAYIRVRVYACAHLRLRPEIISSAPFSAIFFCTAETLVNIGITGHNEIYFDFFSLHLLTN